MEYILDSEFQSKENILRTLTTWKCRIVPPPHPTFLQKKKKKKKQIDSSFGNAEFIAMLGISFLTPFIASNKRLKQAY